jgi:hypothetical protein
VSQCVAGGKGGGAVLIRRAGLRGQGAGATPNLLPGGEVAGVKPNLHAQRAEETKTMRYDRPNSEGSKLQYKARYGNYINGEFVPPARGMYFENISPVTGR